MAEFTGFDIPGRGYSSPIAPKSEGLFGEGTYNAALETSAEDYDEIMKHYEQFLQSRSPGRQIMFTPITPQLAEYRRGHADRAIAPYKELAETGGYSDEDISNLRSRGVSPIRAIYDSAQRNLSRNRALQGGYSPSYTAATTKMARELSEQLGQANTNIEASLAEGRARGRLSAMSSLAPLSANIAESEARGRREIDVANAGAVNRANELNMMMPLQYEEFNRAGEAANVNSILQGIEGMRMTYGTTPALASTFGNQVLQNKGMENNEANIRRDNAREKSRMILGAA